MLSLCLIRILVNFTGNRKIVIPVISRDNCLNKIFSDEVKCPEILAVLKNIRESFQKIVSDYVALVSKFVPTIPDIEI